VSSFASGIYLQWEVTGNVEITFTKTGGPSAVLNGLFFDPPTAMSPLVKMRPPGSGTSAGGASGLEPVASPDPVTAD
jgi:hypothetical protein